MKKSLSRTSSEKRVVNKIIAYLRSQGAWCFKVHGGPMQIIGLPDVIACYRGYFLAIEVKAPDNQDGVTDLQKDTLEAISRAGGLACVAVNVTDIEFIIDSLRKQPKA